MISKAPSPAVRDHSSVIFRARSSSVTREDSGPVHVRFDVDCGKKVTIAMPCDLAVQTGHLMESATFREARR